MWSALCEDGMNLSLPIVANRLHLLLGLASAVFLGFVFHGTKQKLPWRLVRK
jgi:hypothetical protein